MPEKYFTVDGIATYVRHEGGTSLPEVAPDLSRGELVLCLHGSGGNSGHFRALSKRLAERHSPLSFDQPGHARSGSLDSLGSVERLADFTRAFADKLGLRSAVLLGHSLGGAVAQEIALTSPERVRALVLCSSGARFPSSQESERSTLERLRRVTEGKERRQFARDAYSPGASNDVLRVGFGEEMKTDPRVTYGDLLAASEFDSESRVAGISVPTLVVHGEDEGEFMTEQAELLASRIPGARKVAIARAGHMVPLEQPEALADAVLAFLAELSG